VDGLHGLARLRFVAAEVEIRPGSAADLVALVAALGQRDFFADRLARQHEGRGVLLVAWLAHRPAGEDTARRLGDERLALGVGLANVDARRLYERLGYVDWGHGPVMGTWRAVRDDGITVAVSQLFDLLVKHL
jgi:GNAT superfamily N-acetyltransferase